MIKDVWEDINDTVFKKGWNIPGFNSDEYTSGESISDDETAQDKDDSNDLDFQDSSNEYE